MAALQPESFQLALQSLRGQLHGGALAPGARITATEVAASLNLSPTPVREALAWLAGEGIVEERGQSGRRRFVTNGGRFTATITHVIFT